MNTILDTILAKVNEGPVKVLVSTLGERAKTDLNIRWKDKNLRGQIKAWAKAQGLDHSFTDLGKSEMVTFRKL